MQTLSRQQLRTRETQSRLLHAAQEVFLRHGYENAQLDEIAATAGRSKGAVYTHFKSKEDLFLALFEQRTKEYIDSFMARLAHCTNRKQRLETFREFYAGLAHDRSWPILTLEFKLFAIRHPESKERLRKAFEMTRPATAESDYENLFGPLSRAQRADINLSLATLGPIISGLILETYFEPETLSEKALRRVLGRIFDALFPAQL